INNLVSIEMRHALGAYDLDRVHSDVVFRAASAGETYRGIGRGELNLEGLPVFCDVQGPFGSPTSDSERTMITLESKRIALVIIPCCQGERLENDFARTTEFLKRYAAATNVETKIVEGK